MRRLEGVVPYESGKFYRRELPCLLRVLEDVRVPILAILIDGYVWLSDEGEPGLGAYLYEALGSSTPVIGVAKSRFLTARSVTEVMRGRSMHPLYVTAVGIDGEEAAQHVRKMHGPFRVPTLIRKADQLGRWEDQAHTASQPGGTAGKRLSREKPTADGCS